MNFRAGVLVQRLTTAGKVVGFSADIEVQCDDCGLPFRWLGLAAGASPAEPRVSADALELRAPLEPAYVTEILGKPLRSGHA